MQQATALVITSISEPNPVLAACAAGCQKEGVDFVVIGDVSSPKNFCLPDCFFMDIEQQRSLPLHLARILPERSYARKNLGYLLAMQRGAKVIIETDDDNFPREEFWNERIPWQHTSVADGCGWINIYSFFSEEMIWPRGYPIQLVQQPREKALLLQRKTFCPIQQGLADDNPDVDALYRMLMPLPVRFMKGPKIALGEGSWSPFNSQNTTWFEEAFPLLYLPSYCSFRMCDIWRSFVAMRICWANGWHILFHGPSVWQERNKHDLLKDFSDEVVGYVNNFAICEMLEGLNVRPGKENLGENLLVCYEALIKMGHVGDREIYLLEAWLKDMARVYFKVDSYHPVGGTRRI